MTDTTLSAFIAASPLSDEDKAIWTKAFTILNEAQVQVLTDVIGDDEAKLAFMTENFKEKHEAFQSRDSTAMQATLDKEASFIGAQVTA